MRHLESENVKGINVQWGSGQGFAQSDIAAIKKLGFDTIRLSIYWNLACPTSSTVTSGFYTVSCAPSVVGLDTIVNWIKAVGINVILCFCWTPSYPPPTWTGISSNSEIADLLNSPTAYNGFIAMVAAIAQHYGNKVTYEILNEPSTIDVSNAAPYGAFLEAAYDAINASISSPQVLVPFLAAGGPAEEIAGSTPADPTGDGSQPHVNRNITWVQHVYTPVPANGTEWGYDYTTGTYGWISDSLFVMWRMKRCSDYAKANGQKICCTEFGRANSDTYQVAYIQLVISLFSSLGYTGWIYNEYDAGSNLIGAGYNIVGDPAEVAVLSALFGATPKTSKAPLIALALLGLTALGAVVVGSNKKK
jgi:aryl-phospho-beta-D-glucosidase BglC (GH1 family)